MFRKPGLFCVIVAVSAGAFCLGAFVVAQEHTKQEDNPPAALDFEEVQSDRDLLTLERARVQAGWLVIVREGTTATAMTFVYDPDHAWQNAAE
jgi:hypothetical protein